MGGIQKRNRGNILNVCVIQLVDNILESQGNMALGCVDLEKAFDTVPIEMVLATVKWTAMPKNRSQDGRSNVRENKGKIIDWAWDVGPASA